MVYEFKFPDIGEGVHEGEILQWFVDVDEHVEKEQDLLEVHTEKVTTKISSPVAGKIGSIEREEGEIVKVGDVLVRIETKESRDEVAEMEEEKDEAMFQQREPIKKTETKEEKKKKETTKRILAPPAIRRRAREEDVDLHNVEGTGPGGRITKKDFEQYLEQQKAQPPIAVSEQEEHVPLRGTRRNIAENMQKSKRKAAHYTYVDEVDMSALDTLREKAKPIAEKKGVKLTYLPLIVKSLVPALKQYPYLNSSLNEDKEEIVVKHYYNIGIAVDTPEGLLVPVVKHVNEKSVWEVAKEIETLAKQARNGELSLEDVQGGTFSVTNIGPIGGLMGTPVIRWPEVAVLGLNRAKYRPVAVEKKGTHELAIRKMMYLSLSVDHRVVDGAIAARFTNVVKRYIENPELLFLEIGDTL